MSQWYMSEQVFCPDCEQRVGRVSIAQFMAAQHRGAVNELLDQVLAHHRKTCAAWQAKHPAPEDPGASCWLAWLQRAGVAFALLLLLLLLTMPAHARSGASMGGGFRSFRAPAMRTFAAPPRAPLILRAPPPVRLVTPRWPAQARPAPLLVLPRQPVVHHYGQPMWFVPRLGWPTLVEVPSAPEWRDLPGASTPTDTAPYDALAYDALAYDALAGDRLAWLIILFTCSGLGLAWLVWFATKRRP